MVEAMAQVGGLIMLDPKAAGEGGRVAGCDSKRNTHPLTDCLPRHVHGAYRHRRTPCGLAFKSDSRADERTAVFFSLFSFFPHSIPLHLSPLEPKRTPNCHRMPVCLTMKNLLPPSCFQYAGR